MGDRVFTGCEVRAEGRVLSGTVLTYGEVSPSHRERFLPGALVREGHVWLDLEHDPTRVVAWEGAGLTFDDTPQALTMRAELPRIPAADLALEGVRDGTRSGLSVEFRATRERREAQTGVRVVEKARLAGVGLVSRPSYPGSRVEARQRTLEGVSGRVALGERIACQCRDGCDAVNISVDAFDQALRLVEQDARLLPLFFSGRFDRPLARAGDGLTVRRVGRQLEIVADGLPDTADARDFLETVGAGGTFQMRPYFPDRSSEIVKEGTTAMVRKADLRGIEIASVAGPTEGIQPLSLGALVDADLDDVLGRRNRRRVWL